MLTFRDEYIPGIVILYAKIKMYVKHIFYMIILYIFFTNNKLNILMLTTYFMYPSFLRIVKIVCIYDNYHFTNFVFFTHCTQLNFVHHTLHQHQHNQFLFLHHHYIVHNLSHHHQIYYYVLIQ